MKKLLLCVIALILLPSLASAQTVTVPHVSAPDGTSIQAGAVVLADSSGAEKGTTSNPLRAALTAGQSLVGNTIKNLVVVSTTTPLAANGIYGGSMSLDVGDPATPIGYSTFTCAARSDAASTATGFQIFESTDNTNWQYLAGGTVSAATFPATASSSINAPIYARYLRVVFNNSATPQTIFYLFCRIS